MPPAPAPARSCSPPAPTSTATSCGTRRLAAAVPPGLVNLGPLRRDDLARAIRAAGHGGRPHRRRRRWSRPCSTPWPRISASCRCWNMRSRRPGSAAASGTRLTLDAYGEAGGIDGAVAKRANEHLRPPRRGRAGRGPAPVRQPRHPRRGPRGHARPRRPARRPGHGAPWSAPSAAPRPASWSRATMRCSTPSCRRAPGRDQPRGADPRVGPAQGRGSRPTARRSAAASGSAPGWPPGRSRAATPPCSCRQASRSRKAASSSTTMAMS